MNLLLKSSILTLLSASLSSTAYANICVETGQNAAELVILNNWCQPFASATSYPTGEEKCRAVAIDTCRDRDTLRGIIDDWCPDTRPRNSDINNLRGYCRSTVDGLIGWTPAPTRRPTRPPTRRPTPAPVPPTVERVDSELAKTLCDSGGRLKENQTVTMLGVESLIQWRMI